MGRARVRAICFLAGVVFLSRNAGEMTHQLERALGLLCFIVFCLSYAERRVSERRWALISLGIVLLVAGALVLWPDPPAAVAALALMTVGLWLVAEGSGVSARDGATYALTVLGFALLLLVGKAVPEAWYAGRGIAGAVCWVSSAIAGSTVDFRPNFAGLPITALLLLFWTVRWSCSEECRLRELVWPLALTLVVQVLYLIAAAAVLPVLLPIADATAGKSVSEVRWYQAALSRSVPWNLPFLVFLMNVPVLLWGAAHTCTPRESKPPAAGHEERLLLGACAYFAALVLLCFWPFGGFRATTKPVVFYEKGFLNWSVPEFGHYGPLSVGMFGNLPRFVEALGLTSRREAEITTATLEGAAALVIINLDHALPPGTTSTIWQFVEGGGSLLVLSDHTAYEPSGRVFVNELLAPTEISVNFDSANTPVGGWLHGYDYQWHPLTVGMSDERNEAGIVVGASLSIRRPAYPIILGRYGYEDRGNRFAADQGYLGNMQFDADEPLGDPVLLAAQRYGAGKVLVFGDTSSFVNGIVVSTYGFVGSVFRWLATPGGHALQAWVALIALLLVAVAAFVLWRGGPPRRVDLLLLVVILVALLGAARHQRVGVARQPLRGEVAYIDRFHLPMASEESARDNGLMGLQMNLMRNGLLAFNLFDFDAESIANARLLVMVAPARRFSDEDVATVRRFLEGGGTVILSVGWEESAASRPLLDAFGLEIQGMPLGYFRPDSPLLARDAMIWKGWPVRDRSGRARVICGHGEYPVIVSKQIGKGWLVVIGDSDFLLNKNLEAEKTYNETNIQFFRALLQHLGLAREVSAP